MIACGKCFFFIKPTLYLFAWIVKCNFLLDVCYVSSKITCVRLHETHFVFRLFIQKFPFTKMTDFQLHKLFCNNCRSQSIRKKILIHAAYWWNSHTKKTFIQNPKWMSSTRLTIRSSELWQRQLSMIHVRQIHICSMVHMVLLFSNHSGVFIGCSKN